MGFHALTVRDVEPLRGRRLSGGRGGGEENVPRKAITIDVSGTPEGATEAICHALEAGSARI